VRGGLLICDTDPGQDGGRQGSMISVWEQGNFFVFEKDVGRQAPGAKKKENNKQPVPQRALGISAIKIKNKQVTEYVVRKNQGADILKELQLPLIIAERAASCAFFFKTNKRILGSAINTFSNIVFSNVCFSVYCLEYNNSNPSFLLYILYRQILI